jgi:hypothetical protein
VCEIVLDRPQQRNALSAEMIGSLAAAIAAADVAADCRCVVIKSSSEHFCAGRELAPDRERDLNSVLAYDDAYAAIFERLRVLNKPSLAVVRGYAVAGGFTLAMGCDFVIADESAKFGAVEMNNRFPAAINTALLSHLLGPRRALEILLLGEMTGARAMHDMGLGQSGGCRRAGARPGGVRAPGAVDGAGSRRGAADQGNASRRLQYAAGRCPGGRQTAQCAAARIRAHRRGEPRVCRAPQMTAGQGSTERSRVRFWYNFRPRWGS